MKIYTIVRNWNFPRARESRYAILEMDAHASRGNNYTIDETNDHFDTGDVIYSANVGLTKEEAKTKYVTKHRNRINDYMSDGSAELKNIREIQAL